MPITLASGATKASIPPNHSGLACLLGAARHLIGLLMTLLMLGTPMAYANSTASATSATQDPAAIADLVHDFLSTAAASSHPGTALITVDTSRIKRQPACDQPQAFLSSGQRLRSRMSVSVRCMAPSPWATNVQASLSIQGYYYVANRAIQPGDTISLDDLIAREGDLLRLSPGIATDPSLLIGHIATQRITTGAPVKTSALRDPESIQRGQMVRTEVRGPGFVASGEGLAMQSGAPGAQIQVKSSSGQIITGTVLNASTVLVM